MLFPFVSQITMGKSIVLCIDSNLHYEKKGCFTTSLVTQFLSCKKKLNSLYLYTMSANEQVAWIIELQFTIYMVQFIATQLQFSQNNLFSTTMQFYYNSTHDVMLTPVIVINLL
jgi:hypothetical protein